MSWRDLLNVQNVEKGFFASSNSYGIPDIIPDEFAIKSRITRSTLLLSMRFLWISGRRRSR